MSLKCKFRYVLRSVLVVTALLSIHLHIGVLRAYGAAPPDRSRAPIYKVDVAVIGDDGKPVKEGGKIKMHSTVLRDVPDGSNVRLHPDKLKPSQESLGTVNVEEMLRDLHRKPTRDKVAYDFMKEKNDLRSPVLARSAEGRQFLDEIRGELVGLNPTEIMALKRKYKDRQSFKLKALIRDFKDESTSAKDRKRLKAEIEGMLGSGSIAPHAAKSPKKRGALAGDVSFLTKTKKNSKGVSIPDLTLEDEKMLVSTVEAASTERFKDPVRDFPFDAWLLKNEKAPRIDNKDKTDKRPVAAEGGEEYFKQIKASHLDLMSKNLKKIKGTHYDLFNAAVTQWIDSDGSNRKKYAKELKANYDNTIREKLGGSPIIIDPSGEISLSDGHHGLRKAAELVKEIKRYDPEMAKPEHDDEFAMPFSVTSNFMNPRHEGPWEEHLLEVCERRQMYLGPEARADIIRDLILGANDKDFTPGNLVREKKLRDAVERLDGELDALKDNEPRDEAAINDAERAYHAALTEHDRALDGMNSSLASHLQAATVKKFEANIHAIRHYSMRSFIGALLPHHDFERGMDRKNYRAKIGNDGLHDYAEFYVAEWLEKHGFKPNFTADTIQLSPPSKALNPTSDEYKEQMSRYINTLASMAQARRMMFGDFHADFRDLLGRITREDRLKKFLTKLQDQYPEDRVKYPAGSHRGPEYDEFAKSPVEKFDAQVARYNALNAALPPPVAGDALADVRAQVRLVAPRACAVPLGGGVVGGAGAGVAAAAAPAVCMGALGAPPLGGVAAAALDAVRGVLDADMNRKVEAALNHVLFSKGTCLNPLSLERDQLRQEITQALTGGGGMAAAAADVARGAPGPGADVVRSLGDYPEKLDKVVKWLEEGNYNGNR